MKKIVNFGLFFIGLMGLSFGVKASTCSDARVIELTSLANNVRISYEQYNKYSEPYYEETFGIENYQDVYRSFYITIYNLPKELNALVVRNDTKKALVVTNDNVNSDGVIYVDAGEADMIKEFSIDIRSNDSNCKNEVFKTATITTPMYNSFNNKEICNENPSFELCQEFSFSDYSGVTDKEFLNSLNDYKEKKEKQESLAKSPWYNIKLFIGRFKVIIIIAVICVIVGVIYYFIKKKRSKLS